MADLARRARGRLVSTFREATSPIRSPDFLVLGAQKGATTSLYEWLRLHPETELGPRKELHHFDRLERPRPAAYRARFPMRAGRDGHCTRGEATPEYLFLPWVPDAITDALGELRYLVVLRDPVERAYSHYRMIAGRGDEPLGFLDALRVEPERLAAAGWPDGMANQDDVHRVMRHSYATRGHYADQLERWWRRVPRERFLLLRFEDLVAEPTRFAREIQEFLGLPFALTGAEWPHDHAGPVEMLDPEVGAWLRDRLREPNERLADLTGITWHVP